MNNKFKETMSKIANNNIVRGTVQIVAAVTVIILVSAAINIGVSELQLAATNALHPASPELSE